MPLVRSTLCAGALGAVLLTAGSAGAAEETLRYGRFGTVALYRRTALPTRVVLFVSGDGGWNLGVVDMARELAALDTLVIGIDITRLLRGLAGGEESCSYPAADFEALAKFVEKKLAFPAYVSPVLVGYSSGATLVYAVLAQAPAGTFQGAISLGFCPDLEVPKPLCRGSGLAWELLPKGKCCTLLPTSQLPAPWIALQGAIDRVCDAEATAAYVRKVDGGEIVLLPKVGHGFSVQRNWLSHFKAAFDRLVARPAVPIRTQPQEPLVEQATGVGDLPLIEVPAVVAATGTLAVMVSGDGGWAGIDRELAAALSRQGIAVVGLDSLRYFWKARDPETAGADLTRIIHHYLRAWRCERALLVGYSFGANVLPFMASRLPPELRARTALIALLGPGRTAEFEFHLLDWVGRGEDQGLPLLPEIGKLGGTKLLCVAGKDERYSVCPTLAPGQAKVLVLGGGHHFGGVYRTIVDAILAEL